MPIETKQWGRFIFRRETVHVEIKCSECNIVLKKFDTAWVSRAKNGKVAKRVCSESCGLDFDLRDMESHAEENNR